MRDKLGLYPLRDPIKDRPLQPGGDVLPGDTPEARDLAFGREIAPKLPLLFGEPIRTVDQAKAAEAQLLALDVTNLKVGIPLNRLSEDIAHGKEHASVAQWLPEVPPTIADSDRPAWYEDEDRYLADPSQNNLRTLIQRHMQLVNTSRLSNLAELSAVKFRALLVWQDRIRHRSENTPAFVTPDVLAEGYNPIWEVGEIARQSVGRNPMQLGMDADTQKKKLAGEPVTQQEQDLRLSWFWAGWLSDQGLFKTSHDDKVRLGQWLSESLFSDGPYAIHNTFFNARRQAVVSNDAPSWGEALERRRRIWDLAGLRVFNYYVRELPSEPEQRRLYITFTSNCIRMNLLLLMDDIARTGVVWVKKSAIANAKVLLNFIRVEQPEETLAADKLQEAVSAVIANAPKERY